MQKPKAEQNKYAYFYTEKPLITTINKKNGPFTHRTGRFPNFFICQKPIFLFIPNKI